MTIHLPEDLERYVQSQVHLGRFASADEAITEAVRLLRHRLQEQAATARPMTEEEFDRQLMESGLLASIPPRQAGTPAPRDFQPVKIEGEPLSETIIRERR
jgi:putative addiction module CopG family antidote